MSASLTHEQINQLMQTALKARVRAYAPYSHYLVGAALLLESGEVIEGVNVENASYGLCICAERSAVVTAVTQGKKDFKAMAIATSSIPAGAPCGACRQVLSEFAPSLQLILGNEHGEIVETTLAEIFPMQFSKEQLSSGVKSE